MKKLLLILAITAMAVFSQAQIIATGYRMQINTTSTGVSRIYLTGTGATVPLCKTVDEWKDSTWHRDHYPTIQFAKFKSSRNDGLPTSIVWFDSDGYQKRSNTNYIYDLAKDSIRARYASKLALDSASASLSTAISSKDPSMTNELQTLSISGQDITLSAGGGTVSVPVNTYTAGAGVGISSNVITASDTSPTNELQSISILGNTITMSNGGGSVSVPVNVYTAGSGISIASNVVTNTGDLSTTNEVQTLTKAGSTISLSLGGGSVADSDGQTLSLSGATLSISGGNSVTIPVPKKQETYSGTTNASGVYTVTFPAAYSVAPNIQANIINGTDTQNIRTTSISTTGFTVLVRNRVDVIGLLPTWQNVTGATVDVLITEK